jgi:hypothetical protein
MGASVAYEDPIRKGIVTLSKRVKPSLPPPKMEKEKEY